jgi:ABC-type antimicrobial peptide transport system permease subunit
MVYVIGIIGFIAGFALGQMILYFLLRHKSRDELLTDSSLKWQYGLLNWAVAGLCSYAAVYLYGEYLMLSGGW